MQDTTPTNEPDAAPAKRGVLFRIFRFCLLAGLFLFLALAITLFFARSWITDKAQTVLNAELNRRGIHLEYSDPRYTAVRGLVLSDITLFRSAEKTKPLLALSDLAARIDPLKSYTTKQLAIHISSRDATLSATQGDESTEVTGLNLRADVHGDRLEVHHLKGTIESLEIELSADLPLRRSGEKKAAPEPSPTADAKQEDQALETIDLSPLMEAVRNLRFDVDDDLPKLTVHIAEDASGKAAIEAQLSGENFSWKDLPIESVDLQVASEIDASGSTIRFPVFDLSYRGEQISASGSVDPEAGEVTLETLDSTADLLALGADLSGKPLPVSFEAPPQLNLSGVWRWKTPETSQLTARFSNESRLIVPVGDRELTVHNLSGILLLDNGAISTKELTASVLDGTVALRDASIRPFDEALPFQGALTASDVPLASIAAFSGTEKERSGHLNLSFSGSGSSSLEVLNGSGRIEFAEARFFTIPIFGRIHEIFKTLTLPFNKDSTSGLTANYRIDNGVLHTEDLSIKGEGIVIEASGQINLADTDSPEAARLQAKAKLGGLLGGATSLVTGLAEVEGIGPVSDVSWRPTLIPKLSDIKNLPEKIGDIGGAVKGARDQIKNIDQLPGAVTEQVLEGIGSIFGRKKPAPSAP